MNSELEKLKKDLGIKWANFITLHNAFLSFDKEANFRIFPIYVVYSINDAVFAVIYFKGNLVTTKSLVLGFKFERQPLLTNLQNPPLIKYLGINYSLKLNVEDEINDIFIEQIKNSI